MIASHLVEFASDGPRLLAGRRKVDGSLVFPLPRDEAFSCERVHLSAQGRLWSWTVQRFRPKSPPYRLPEDRPFRPYVVGYVEFPEGLVVEGYIDARPNADRLQIGQPMQTTVIPLLTEPDGDVIHIYAFRP